MAFHKAKKKEIQFLYVCISYTYSYSYSLAHSFVNARIIGRKEKQAL